jgi:hypothetical protein
MTTTEHRTAGNERDFDGTFPGLLIMSDESDGTAPGVGLILVVPATVIAADAISRLRSRGVIDQVAERAKPAIRTVLD